MLVDDLHFQIDYGIIVQDNSGIKEKGFIVNGRTQLNGIGDDGRQNLFRRQMEQRADKSLQYLVAALKECAEQIIVGHGNNDGTLCRVQKIIFFVHMYFLSWVKWIGRQKIYDCLCLMQGLLKILKQTVYK